MYGASLYACETTNDYGCEGFELLKYFNFKPSMDSDLSLISSDPTRVCLCNFNKTVNCTIVFTTLEQAHYPGEEFYIPAVAVGPAPPACIAKLFSNTISLLLDRMT